MVGYGWRESYTVTVTVAAAATTTTAATAIPVIIVIFFTLFVVIVIILFVFFIFLGNWLSPLVAITPASATPTCTTPAVGLLHLRYSVLCLMRIISTLRASAKLRRLLSLLLLM